MLRRTGLLFYCADGVIREQVIDIPGGLGHGSQNSGEPVMTVEDIIFNAFLDFKGFQIVKKLRQICIKGMFGYVAPRFSGQVDEPDVVI